MSRRAPRPLVAAALALATGTVLACGGEGRGAPTDPGPLAFTLSIASAPHRADTVQAGPAEALVVKLTGASGRPAPHGIVVNFAVPAPVDPRRQRDRAMLLCAPIEADCGSLRVEWYQSYDAKAFGGYSDTTDASGSVRALVRFGSLAGPTTITVSVPEYGLQDSLPFVVAAGAPTRVVLDVRDTLLKIGGRSSASAHLEDRFGNVREERPTFTSSEPSSVVVDSATGDVSASASGDAIVTASYRALSDTALVTVMPVGRFAAFAVGRGLGREAFTGLLIANLDGSGRREVIATLGLDPITPQLSPDGTRVLYLDRVDSLSGTQIFEVDTGGRKRREFEPRVAHLPRFSRDGRYIYYSYSDQLWRVRSDGTDPTELLSDLNPTRDLVSFDVSPDGSRLVYTPNDGQLRVVTIATGEVRGLGVAGANPRWSPDGVTIVFSGGSEIGGIFSVPAAGGTRRQLSPPGQAYISSFELSPDGQWALARPNDRRALELIHLSDARVLVLPSFVDVFHPSWR